MAEWNYQREEAEFPLIPAGNHRIRIKSAERAVSKTGRDMITLQFDVSNYTRKLFFYIVFMPDNPGFTNRVLTSFYDSFKDIPEGNTDLASWVGKVGAGTVVHEEYNGKQTDRLKYFISVDKQGELPPWVEKADEVIKVDAADVPDVPFI